MLDDSITALASATRPFPMHAIFFEVIEMFVGDEENIRLINVIPGNMDIERSTIHFTKIGRFGSIVKLIP